MQLRACLATTLLLAAALTTHAQPTGAHARSPALALRSPAWALFAPPPPAPRYTPLANLYTIVNERALASPSYLNAYHHNLLALHPHLPKPLLPAKSSVQESPLKIYQPAPVPFAFQTFRRTGIADPYSFPTNRPPPAVATTEPPATPPPTPSSTTPTTPAEPESSEAPTTEGSSPTTPSTDGSSPLPPGQGKPTLLILKPFAKAVAGINGTAVATPVGHAVYHKGQPVDVLFDPRAVAVAGPGGNARAHSDLIVSYIEKE